MEDSGVAGDAPRADAAELSTLTASAAQHYGQKKYESAAELYSQAVAIQAELNGEMDSRNADLLYAYGRCLFQLGVSKSDVLGGKVASDGKDQESNGKKRKREPTQAGGGEGPSASAEKSNIDSADSNKPFFELSGDGADWEDASDPGDDAAYDEDGDEEDDLATAYEILDLARLLFEKQVEARAEANEDPRASRELLADVHDLQAEISLENERFQDAISDSKASLLLKQDLYPPEKGIVAEAHFKLSLALEFASVTVQSDQDTKQVEEAQVDESLRADAASEMEAAIECTRVRESKLKEAIEAGTHEKATAKDLVEIKEILQEMEQRVSVALLSFFSRTVRLTFPKLVDLKNPAVSIKGADGGDDSNPLGGILGSILGETPAAQKAKIDEAAKGANDLSGLVRRKPQAEAPGDSKGKRKAEDAPEQSKRARTEEPS